MKIDVITLHNTKNYGSALQTYATQTILENLNNEVEIINYFRENAIEENLVENAVKNSQIFSKNFLTRTIGKILLTSSINKNIKVFNSFLDKYIHLTKKYYSNEELKKDTPKADIYCTGSDQVWNSEWNQGIKKPFFLDFIEKNVPRFAYAASFGKTEIDEEEKKEIAPMLKEYKKISVREDSAIKILEDMGIEDVRLVLDPTLLLNKEEWIKLKENIKVKKPYILVYQLSNRTSKFDTYVKNLAKKKKMPVIRVSVTNYQALKYGKLICCPTVNQFLSYFLEADYIVTDSFHGTAFSINFNKKFVSIFPDRFSSRLQSILNLTGLQERKITDFNNLDIIDKEINYEKVNKIMEEERKKSIDFIKQSIKECDKGEN